MSDKEITENEEEDQIIELVDDDGKVIKFRLLDVTEYKGEKYTLLLIAEPDENIAEDEVVIFRLNEKDETLEPIEDENFWKKCSNFIRRKRTGTTKKYLKNTRGAKDGRRQLRRFHIL